MANYRPIYNASIADIGQLTTPIANALISYRQGLDSAYDGQQQRAKFKADENYRGAQLGIENKKLAMEERTTNARLAELRQNLDLSRQRFGLEQRRFGREEADALSRTPESRASIAQRYGLTPGSPQYQSFVLQGTLPTVSGNQFGRSGTIIQDKAGNFFSVQFGGDGTRRVEPLQINGTGLQPAKGVEQVGDTLRDKATGRVIENVAPNIAGAEQAKLRGRSEAETEASFPKMTQAMNLAKVKWDRVQPAMDRARQLIRSNPTVVGLLGTPQSAIPGSAAFRLRTYLDTIKANIGFQELQAMRDSAPTGASGLGQVTERELNFLQSVISSLDQRLDGPTLLQNLGDVQSSFNRMRSVAEHGYRQTYGKYIKNQPSAPQSTGQVPAAGTYNWTPDGGLQRAR